MYRVVFRHVQHVHLHMGARFGGRTILIAGKIFDLKKIEDGKILQIVRRS